MSRKSTLPILYSRTLYRKGISIKGYQFKFVIPTGSPSFLSRSWDVPIDKGHNLFSFSTYIIPKWSGKVKAIRHLFLLYFHSFIIYIHTPPTFFGGFGCGTICPVCTIDGVQFLLESGYSTTSLQILFNCLSSHLKPHIVVWEYSL